VGAGPLLCPADLGSVRANDEVDVDGTVEEDMGKSTEGSRTDDIVV
jgi:heat shock protein beta